MVEVDKCVRRHKPVSDLFARDDFTGTIQQHYQKVEGLGLQALSYGRRGATHRSRGAQQNDRKRITLGMSMDFRVAGGRESAAGRLSISFAGVNFTVAAAKSHRERWLSVER